MKVFNQIVECCQECNYGYDDICKQQFFCGKLDKEIRKTLFIYQDCPFNKKITREVIEGFGFELVDPLEMGLAYNVYVLNNKNTYTLIARDKFFIITKEIYGDTYILFDGILNNPEELKFILNSLNII